MKYIVSSKRALRNKSRYEKELNCLFLDNDEYKQGDVVELADFTGEKIIKWVVVRQEV